MIEWCKKKIYRRQALHKRSAWLPRHCLRPILLFFFRSAVVNGINIRRSSQYRSSRSDSRTLCRRTTTKVIATGAYTVQHAVYVDRYIASLADCRWLITHANLALTWSIPERMEHFYAALPPLLRCHLLGQIPLAYAWRGLTSARTIWHAERTLGVALSEI